MTVPRWWPWTFGILSLLIALASLRALVLPLDLVMPDMAHFLADQPWGLWGHVLGGPLVLALAPVQLSARIRARWPGLHRWSGRPYALGVLIASLAALSLVPTSVASPWARTGFCVLAVLWVGVTAIGIQAARQGDYDRHRIWMRRSLALTFSAVTLRVMMAPMMAAGMTPAATYDITAWTSWSLNLLVLELWLARRRRAVLA